MIEEEKMRTKKRMAQIMDEFHLQHPIEINRNGVPTKTIDIDNYLDRILSKMRSLHNKNLNVIEENKKVKLDYLALISRIQ